jgi:hypothetical protein
VPECFSVDAFGVVLALRCAVSFRSALVLVPAARREPAKPDFTRCTWRGVVDAAAEVAPAGSGCATKELRDRPTDLIVSFAT